MLRTTRAAMAARWIMASGSLDSPQDGPSGRRRPAGNRQRWVHQVALKCDQHSLGAAFGIKFAQQCCDAVLGGFNREVELIGNLLIAEAFAKTAQHVFFPQAQHIAEGMVDFS